MPDLPLPVEFRSEIIEPVLSRLRTGESCALVGVGSSGKSNIARHLKRADVRLHYFEASAAQIFVLYLNCKPLADRAPHDLYLQVLDELARAARELDGAFTSLQPGIDDLLEKAQATPDRMAKRNLDIAISQVVKAGAELVIVILDDCDDLFTKAPAVLFSDLRALRDNYKVRLAYLTLTRREPVFLRLDTPEYEELFELLSPAGHTLAIPPYSEADGVYMLRRLAARQDPPRQIGDDDLRQLYELGGGHAGLIRALFFATQDGDRWDTPEAIGLLVAHADVEDECQRIVSSLEEVERIDLQRIVNGEEPSAEGLHRLERRGLIRARPLRPPEVFSVAFEQFLKQPGRDSGEIPEIEFLDSEQQARVQGRLITTLVFPEYEILRVLHANHPQPCSRLALIEVMRRAEQKQPSESVRGKPLDRLQQYVRQLKAKIGNYIRPEGDGYILRAPEIGRSE